MLDKNMMVQNSQRDIINIYNSDVKINNNQEKEDSSLSDNEIISMSKNLLDISQPASLLNLFPDADDNIRQAIEKLQVQPRFINRKEKEELHILEIYELLNEKDLLHLIMAPGGAGKTHSLWNLGKKILNEDKYIPIYISLRDFTSTKDIIDFLLLKLTTKDIKSIIKNPRVVFLLDGWSEFPNDIKGFNDSEKRKLLGILGERKIIATSRYSTEYDVNFKIWNLEGLSNLCIRETISIAFKNNSLIPREIYDFLRLPLFLILYLLFGGNEVNQGILINKFHQNLTMYIDDSDALTKIMGIAAANFELLEDSRNHRCEFDIEIDYVAKKFNYPNAKDTINKLGVLGARHDVIHPIHDLYWEWLVGCGIFNNWDEINFKVIRNLKTRKSCKLYAQSGNQISIKELQLLSIYDIVFAAELLSYFRIRSVAEEKVKTEIFNRIDNMLNHENISIRYRGLLAGLSSKDKGLFMKSLDMLADFHKEGHYFNTISEILEVEILWKYRDEIGRWLKEEYGNYYIINVIKTSRDSKWVDWIKEQFFMGNVSRKEAVEVVLACTSDLPNWIEDILPELLIHDKGAYCLREAAKRGDNISLAHWVYDNYDKYGGRNDSLLFHFNEVLIQCGNDSIYDEIIDRFETFEPDRQEILSFAIVEMGAKRLARLQSKIFKDKIKSEHHEIYNNIQYDEISDEQARIWTNSKDEKISCLGWKVLSKRYQDKILDELIYQLPSSFSKINYLPSLKAMKVIDILPESLIDELLDRFKGQIQPMLMDDLIQVFSRIKPYGIPRLVGILRDNPRLFPTYHMAKFITYLKEWEEENELKIIVESNHIQISFSEFLVLNNISREEDNYFIAEMCNSVESDLVVNHLVHLWECGNNNIYNIIKRMKLKKYNASLVKLILSQPQGVKECISLYGQQISTFPEEILMEMLEIILKDYCSKDLLKKFIYEISRSPWNKHIKLHTKILNEVINHPYNEVDLYRKTAMILSVYSDEKVKELLELGMKTKSVNSTWLIRNIEIYKNELLIDEEGKWLSDIN